MAASKAFRLVRKNIFGKLKMLSIPLHQFFIKIAYQERWRVMALRNLSNHSESQDRKTVLIPSFGNKGKISQDVF